MTLQERLRGYNPPDRTIDSQRQIAVDIHEAADALDAQEKRIKELEEALRACVDDLEAELTHRYDGTLNYPVMKRRYDSDMSTVQRAREALK